MPIGTYCHHEFLNTDAVPPEQRFAFWRDVCLHRLEPYASAGTDGEPFTASVRELVAPDGRFTDLHVTASGVGRTSRLYRAEGIDNIVVSITLSGGGAGWFGDPDRAMKLGTDLVRVRDEGSPYVVQWTGANNHTLHVDVPRARLDSRTLGRVLGANGTQLSSRGLASILAAQARALAGIMADLDPAARAAGLCSIVDLAATVLRLEFGSDPADSEACEDGMLVAAQALIRRSFGSRDLSPENIARRLGCSRAHLYRLFARRGLTVAGYLREVRLERCRVALAAAMPGERVADIAFRCGFDNPVHFTRLFRQRFGMRPSEMRAHTTGT